MQATTDSDLFTHYFCTSSRRKRPSSRFNKVCLWNYVCVILDFDISWPIKRSFLSSSSVSELGDCFVIIGTGRRTMS